MTKTYAAKRLLEHGPLTFGEFVTVTGWPYSKARKTISYLQESGVVVWADGAWRLA